MLEIHIVKKSRRFQKSVLGGPLMIFCLCTAAMATGQDTPNEASTDHIKSELSIDWFRLGVATVSTSFAFSQDRNHAFVGSVLGAFLSAPTLRWDNFTWTTFEIGALIAYNYENGAFLAMFAGSRIGLPFALDDAGRHEISVDMAIDGGLIGFDGGDYQFQTTKGRFSLLFGPLVNYSYRLDSGLVLGAGLRTILAPFSDWKYFISAILLTVDIGY